MSEIFSAMQRSSDTRVIIKKLSCQLDGQAVILKRFSNEARIASSLSHENVITIYDYGEERGSFYIVMEQVDGCDLERLMEHPGFNRDIGLMIVSRALEGLRFAHINGVIHCDIKPANILIDRTGRVVLSDFGLSMARAHTMNPAHEKSDYATPLYMPPEQAKVIAEQVGLASDAWAETASIIYTDMSPDQARAIMERGIQWDLWSVGVLLYRLCSGRFPFHGDDLPGLLTAVVHTEETKIHELVTDLPPHLTSVIQRCLEKEAYRRPHSLDPVIDSLKKHFTTLDIGNTAQMIAGHIRDKIPAPEPVRQAPLLTVINPLPLIIGKIGRITSLFSRKTPAIDEMPDERYDEYEKPVRIPRCIKPLGVTLVLAALVVSIFFFMRGIAEKDKTLACSVKSISVLVAQKKEISDKKIDSQQRVMPSKTEQKMLPRRQTRSKRDVPQPPLVAKRELPQKQQAPTGKRPVQKPRVQRAPAATKSAPVNNEKINAGILKMTVTPQEARVFVDGAMIPRKVLAEGKKLDPGFHDVLVQAPDCDPYQRSFLLEAYKMQVINVDLKPKVKGNGMLHVYSYPWSDLYVDGTLQGTTPTPAPLVIVEGQHKILLRRDGFKSYEEIVTVKKNEVARIQVQLQRIK